jgi:hypothetical protein
MSHLPRNSANKTLVGDAPVAGRGRGPRLFTPTHPGQLTKNHQNGPRKSKWSYGLTQINSLHISVN